MQTPALSHFGRAGQVLAGEAPSRATPAVLGLPPQRAALPALEPMAAASPIPHEDYARRLDRVERLLVQQGDPDKLLQLEMVRFMAEMRSSRRSDPLESYDPRDELGGAAKTSAGKASAAAEAQRNKMYSQPGRIVEESRRMAMDELGADLGTPWRYRDLHRRVNWGQMKSMQRCFIEATYTHLSSQNLSLSLSPLFCPLHKLVCALLMRDDCGYLACETRRQTDFGSRTCVAHDACRLWHFTMTMTVCHGCVQLLSS